MWILPKNHPLYSAFAQDSFEDLKSELSTHYELSTDRSEYDWFSGSTHDSKITSVYIAVVEYIKWYNQQNK